MQEIKTKISGGILLLYFFWPFLVFASAQAVAPTTAPVAPPPIYISQVQITGGKNNTQEDFIELFNPNPAPVNLKGCRLVKRPAGATSDTLVKTFSKDTFIPAKSFFLWANSGYLSINVKPDVTSSATISDDNGVALRFGADNSGIIINSIAWGKAGGEFNNISLSNPGAGQSLTRNDLYAQVSGFSILPSQPHNSSSSDLAAAFADSRQSAPAQATPPAHSGAQSLPAPLASAAPVQDQVLDNPIIAGDNQPASPLPSGYAGYSQQNSQNGARGYIILAAGALLALGFVCYQFFWKKSGNKT